MFTQIRYFIISTFLGHVHWGIFTACSNWHLLPLGQLSTITNCGKFLKRWEYRTTLTASRETCMQVKKQQWELHMKQWTGSILGKEYIKAIYCHPAYLTYMQSTSWEMPGWINDKLESRFPGEISTNSDMQMIPSLWQKAKEELKGLLMTVKKKSEKAGLKLSIQKMKIMASGPITSWQKDGETMQAVTDFIFLGSKIIVDSNCSHEIKRRLLLGRKTMTNLDSILKSRNITLPTKGCLVKAMGFPVVMYGCEGWTIKNIEHRRIDAFVLWCWRRLSRVPQTSRTSNQSVLKEINPEYSLEGLMLKLKLQYFGHLIWRTDSVEKTLMLGKTRGEGANRGWDGWMALTTQWTWI